MTDLAETVINQETPIDLAERPSTPRRATRTPASGSTQRVAATTGSVARARRRHPALGARILTAGLSTAAMFGIVAALGVENPPPANAVQNPAPAGPAAIVVDPTTSAPMAVTVSELSDQPIQLTATPVVRAAQPAPAQAVAAPFARTNGSR